MKKENFYVFPLVLACTMMFGCSDDTSTAADAANTASSAGGSSDDLGPSIPTGIVSHRDFRIGFDPGVAGVFSLSGSYSGSEQVEVVIRADDINDLVVDGQVVKFRTEWGTFTDEKDSCTLVNGSCSVTWLPGSPLQAPSAAKPFPGESAECRVAFTAWTNGEEKFSDLNDNGVLDTGEVFTDLPEPYLDINESGIYINSFSGIVNGWDGGLGFCNSDNVCELIDTNGNGVHDGPDGKYNGTLCASGNTDCSSTKSIKVWTTSYLLITDASKITFDHDDDTTTPEIGICSGFK